MKNYEIKIATFSVVREGGVSERTLLASPPDAARLARQVIPDDAREHFGIFMLDAKNGLVGYHEVSVGSLTSTLVQAREVFGPALRMMGVAGIILVHNHPSGDVTPSKEDLRLTREMIEAGKILGIDVHDHVIIGNGSAAFASLKEKGLM